jgi:hypothetical protein
LGDVSSRRKVDQRWFYEPVFSEPVTEPVLAKRQSKRPQRLTSSRLGRVSSEVEIMGLIGASSNVSYPECPLIGSEDLMVNNDFATVSSASVISVLATAASSIPGDGDDLTSSGTEPHQSSSEEPAQSMDAPDSSTNPSGDGLMNSSGSQLPLIPRRFSVGDGERTGRFMIRLTFPGGELPDQPLQVTTNMSVRTLRRCLANMMAGQNASRGLQMFVAPSWSELDHEGLIVDMFVPGTATPCPSLGPWSLLRVMVTGIYQGSSSILPPSDSCSTGSTQADSESSCSRWRIGRFPSR